MFIKERGGGGEERNALDEIVIVITLQTVRLLVVDNTVIILPLGEYGCVEVSRDEVTAVTDGSDRQVTNQWELPAVLSGDFDTRTGETVEKEMDSFKERFGTSGSVQAGEKLFAKPDGVCGQWEHVVRLAVARDLPKCHGSVCQRLLAIVFERVGEETGLPARVVFGIAGEERGVKGWNETAEKETHTGYLSSIRRTRRSQFWTLELVVS